MAVESDFSTQSTQQSTQPTQPASQDRAITDTEIWGSLIPFNHNNPHVSRIDFLRQKKTYSIGRSRRDGVNDISFPYFARISHRHCTIEWDGEGTATSAVIVRDLKSSNGTFVNGRRLGKGECRLLRDWNVISFGAPCERSTERSRDDYRFFFRHMASSQRPKDGLYKFYDVQHVLGRGAYATVVKALHRNEGKWYAIKLFSGDRLRELLTSATFRGAEERMKATAKHLRREVQALRGLSHQYVCELKEAFFEGYSVSVVLELVPGGDLMSHVLKRGVLLEPEAQYFTYQICDALAYVHAQGVVHRDLKPENVLLTDDTPPIVKVADFGLAKVIDSLSMMQTKCGTPAFVAPEVMDQSEKGYDKVVDSWSLGVMVFMMIAKTSPFTDDTRGEPDWDLLREYNISDTGIDFISRLLEYDPDKRMSPARALEHEWLTAQGTKQRARMLERELSLARRTQEEGSGARTPTATQPTPAIAEPARGKKRKAGAISSLSRSLSSLSVDDQGNAAGPAAKRARAPDGSPQKIVLNDKPQGHSTASSAWTAFDVDTDEIPGLGTFQDPPAS